MNKANDNQAGFLELSEQLKKQNENVIGVMGLMEAFMNKLDQFGQAAQNVDSSNQHVTHGDLEQHPPHVDDYEDEVVDWEEDDSQHMDNDDSTDEIESEQGGSVLDSTQSWPLCSLSCSIWERCLYFPSLPDKKPLF